ncbi:hypothetical protein [Cupriavidus basilensis]|uniref:hypothetical protein n=1 Tax=Cupriavidus basilensis TaxID=68895 RepID=UPI0012E06F3D|nr:hypothetical protein [Cupriavidus basilensis]
MRERIAASRKAFAGAAFRDDVSGGEEAAHARRQRARRRARGKIRSIAARVPRSRDAAFLVASAGSREAISHAMERVESASRAGEAQAGEALRWRRRSCHARARVFLHFFLNIAEQTNYDSP